MPVGVEAPSWPGEAAGLGAGLPVGVEAPSWPGEAAGLGAGLPVGVEAPSWTEEAAGLGAGLPVRDEASSWPGEAAGLGLRLLAVGKVVVVLQEVSLVGLDVGLPCVLEACVVLLGSEVVTGVPLAAVRNQGYRVWLGDKSA